MKLKLVKKTKEARDTFSFFWDPSRKISYLPGQYFYFTIPNLINDYRGPTRDFSLSSSPTEGNQLRFTTRIRDISKFKQILLKLNAGSIIEAEGPNGTFIIDEKEKGPHVFLAGGIGITPFRSAIKYQNDKNLNIKIHLIYTNKTPELIAFKKELENWEVENKNLKIDMIVTRPQESIVKWNGLTGRIDEKLLKSIITNHQSHKYWLAGPPDFVSAMEKILRSLKVSPEKVRIDKFTGY